MITDNGRLHVRRYFAGLVPVVVQSIAYGIGSKPATITDAKLQFEIGRTDLSVTSLDLVGNKVIYKAELPEDIDGTIYEVAIYSASANAASGQFGSKLITTFDSATEAWAGSDGSISAYTTTGRISSDSLKQTPSASGSRSDTLSQLSIDLSGYSNADTFIFAYNVGNGNTSALRFRFFTNNTNYFDFNLGSQTTGYKFNEVPKGMANATGAPTWENITAIEVTTVSGSGGASSIELDGIRVEDTDTINPDYVMISREVLATPFVKETGKTQEIEFALNINL